ncbi:hypothetical protein POJ06DRAFT_286577 [Lipomyces tetrasporus]|uniref:Hemerythrin-like domain-containing protein n=1 Tax=Lipomyces tetrasporus TaxID=54092 RepID=A0AAD7VQH5_9ASCO|nr:uncharacterized protein POJ06DRAFT_286577 [Lipomyces tetrasporus]KAJ8097165.1 hypothetical protein POJ06DRAFT_286577 [Lipomyces tetrasporus]
MSATKQSHIIDAVKQDHRDIENCYESIINSDDLDTRTRWANQFVWEVATHSIGEEIVLYPAFEKYLQDGQTVADKDRAEHQTAKDDLYTFQSMKATDRNFIPVLNKVMDELKGHIKTEEEVQLPQIERALSAEESMKLAKTFSRTKLFVPTRSHPSAPSKPPFETAVALLTAPIDKVRDIFKKFPEEPKTA